MSKVAIYFLMLLIVVGCGQKIVYYKHEYNSVAHRQLGESKAIALVPVGLLAQEVVYPSLHPVIESEIVSYLEQAGYQVVPRDDFIHAWEEAFTAIGGIYDEKTGRVDDLRLNHCFQLVFERLRKTYDFAMFIIPVITYEDVALVSPYNAGSWDGVVRKVRIEGGGDGRWKAMGAMSLKVMVLSIDGRLVLDNRGGIDFIQKTVTSSRETSKIVKEPEEFSLEDIREAVEVAFHPFITSRRLECESPGSSTNCDK